MTVSHCGSVMSRVLGAQCACWRCSTEAVPRGVRHARRFRSQEQHPHSWGAAWWRSGGTGRMGFIALYVLAYMGAILLLLAPLLVSLSLKVNALVGIDRAPTSLSLVAGTGALLAMLAKPFFGKMSDRTSSRLGMRRPWMVVGLVGGTLGTLVVALAPNIPVVLVGWCIAQLFFNALLAALVAVLPDQVPVAQRGQVLGHPGRLSADRVGERHLRRPAVHR